MAKAPV